jgi:hypothetical protein
LRQSVENHNLASEIPLDFLSSFPSDPEFLPSPKIMKTSTRFLTGLLSCVLLGNASATILLNEIHARTPLSTDALEQDSNYEFVELKSTTGVAEDCLGPGGGPLWLLLIDNDGGGLGAVDQAWKLVDANQVALKTGANGLLLLGDDFLKASAPYNTIKAIQTTLGDPSGMGGDDLGNKAYTMLLVEGYTNPAPLGVDTKPDFDQDNNGTLDWNQVPILAAGYQAAPWTVVSFNLTTNPAGAVDSVGFNGNSGATITPAYCGAGGAAANLSPDNLRKGVTTAGFLPYTIARGGTNTAANSRTGWYGGVTSGTTGDSITYGTNFFNLLASQTWRGQVTPGQPNLSAAPITPVFRINEIHANPPGTPGRSAPGAGSATPALVSTSDGNFEYIEIINTSTATDLSGSLANYSLLLIDNGGGGIGQIVEAWDLSKFSTGSNGLLLLGDGFTNGECPWIKNVDPATQLGDPESVAFTPATALPTLKYTSMSLGDIPNDGITFLLVQNFTSSAEAYIPAVITPPAPHRVEVRDLDAGDDGTLDSTPYTLVDGVCIPEIDPVTRTPVTGRVGYVTAASLSVSSTFSVTGSQATDVITTATAHGLIAGDRVAITVKTGGTGITLGAAYFVRTVPTATTLTLSLTAGGATLDITTDMTAGTLATRAFDPDNLSRIKGSNTASSAAAWSYGVLGSESPYSLSYRNGHYRPTTFWGAGSPGKPNYSASVLPTTGTVRLNEVHIRPPTSPENTEFVELVSTAPHASLKDLWLLIIDASPGASSGLVKKVIDLRSQTTGPNKLAIFADGIEEDTSALAPFCSALTSRDDPSIFFGDGTTSISNDFNFTPDSLAPNSGISVLLVSYPAPTATSVPAQPGTDLDGDNDGVLDAAPGWTVVDSIGIGNGIGGVPVASGAPGNVSRVSGNLTPNSLAAWFGGDISGATSTSFDYGAAYFGTFKGAATPGRANPIATPNPSATLLINEVNINPPGADNNKEFIELRTADNTATSTAGYSLLLVDNEGADIGRVLKVYDLDSGAIGTNGLLLNGSGYDTLMPWLAAAAPEASTGIYAPDSMAFDDIALPSDNGAFTLLLVKYFNGRVGDDLDMGSNTDRRESVPDDAIFNTPLQWSSMADSVAMKGFISASPLTITAAAGSPIAITTSVAHGMSTGASVVISGALGNAAANGNWTIVVTSNTTFTLTGSTSSGAYTSGGMVTFYQAGRIFTGTADLTVPIPAAPNQANGYTPDSVARFANKLTPHDAASWYGANITGLGSTSTVYSTTQYFPSTLTSGKVTPGQINSFALTDTSDPDADGVVNIMEEALGMDIFVPDTQKLPQPGWAVIPGQNGGNPQLTFTVVRPSGGVAGINYAIEASTDLTEWVTVSPGFSSAVKSTIANTPSVGMETKVYGLPTALLSLMNEGRVFFRLCVSRP